MRRLHRRYFVGALGAPLGMLFARSVRAADTYTLRFGFPQSASTVQGQAGIHFATAVQRRTNGQVKIEVFPSGQLATEAALIDALITGVVDFAIHSTSWVEGLLPRYQVLGMPFLFKNEAAGHRLLDGAIGQELLAELEPKGMIGYGWTGAFRELWTGSRTVARPEDMKGLRVRIPGGVVGFATYQALGGLAITIDLAELVSALTQHVIDGIDTIVDGFTGQKLYSVAKYANMLNHIFSVNMMLGSKRKIEALPVALQRMIREEGKATLPFWRSLIARQTADDIDILKKNGVVFTEIQFAAFRKAVEPVYASFGPKIGGDFLERAARAASTGA